MGANDVSIWRLRVLYYESFMINVNQPDRPSENVVPVTATIGVTTTSNFV